MKKRNILKTIALIVGTFLGALLPLHSAYAASCNGVDTAILGCDEGENGIVSTIMLIINIFSICIGIAAAIGITIVGIQYITARDNEETVRKSKRRLLEIVIGLATYVLLYAGLRWLLPSGSLDGSDIPAYTYTPSSNSSSNSNSGSSSSSNSNSASGGGSNNTVTEWSRLCGPERGGTPGTETKISGVDGYTKYTTLKGRVYYDFFQDKYGNDRFKAAGCAVTSTATVVNSFTNTNVISAPTDLTGGIGIDPAAVAQRLAGDYLTVGHVRYNADTVRQVLSAGGAVIVHVTAFWTQSNHYMPLVDYNSSTDKVYIANTLAAGYQEGTQKGWVDLSTIASRGEPSDMYTFMPTAASKSDCRTTTSSGSSSSSGSARSLGVESGVFEKNYNGYTYFVHIPENATEGMPLVAFFHGSGEYNNKYAVSNLTPTKAVQARNDFISVVPVGRVVENYSSDEIANFKGVIDEVAATYKTGKNYVMGFSMGGIRTWSIVNQYPNFFTAAVPVSGFPVNASAGNFTHTKIYAIVGGVESMGTMTTMQNFVTQINEAGGSAKFETYAGQTHDSMSGALKYSEIFDWMLAQ